MKQTGLKNIAPKPTDYKMAGETAATKKVLVGTSDWSGLLPKKEPQYLPTFDTSSCVSFSALSGIEAIFMRKIELGLITPANIEWLKTNGYFIDGVLNFSDRFIAILSGTTKNGNDVVSVGDAIRRNGLIPETHLPLGDNPHLVTPTTFENYIDPTVILPSMIALGKEFLKRFSIVYEWVWFSNDAVFTDNETTALVEALLYGPVQIGIPSPSHHATLMYAIQPLTSYDLFDTYEPYLFHNKWDSGGVHWAFRYSVDEVKVPVIVRPTFRWDYDLFYGCQKGNPALIDDVKAWQQLLIAEGCLKPGLATGNFYDLTVQATRNFQAKYGIATVGRVGPTTRAKANMLCK
jgi:hypothetical protein